MKKVFVGLVALGAAALGAGLWLTAPNPVDSDRFAGLTGDPEAGKTVFTAAGCASCHIAKDTEEGALILAGGQAFTSDYGVFFAPNISSHAKEGIGAWSLIDFANAVKRGISPEGAHYFPAFPYTAYTRMTDQDLVDLWAFVQTLPPDASPSLAHDVGFPFNIRRSLGGWKLMFMQPDWVMPAETPQIERGRYLVEALAHCGECHTPRNALGGLKRIAWMSGAANPSGDGRIPDLTPRALEWSAEDIAYYLETGLTPDFDSAGGHMVPVIHNFAQLGAEDRAAVAAYVKALPVP